MGGVNDHFTRRELEGWNKPCLDFINNYIASHSAITSVDANSVWNAFYSQLVNNDALRYLNSLEIPFQTKILSICKSGPNFKPGCIVTTEEIILTTLNFIHSKGFIDKILSLYVKPGFDLDSISLQFVPKNYHGLIKYDVKVVTTIMEAST